MFDGIKVKGAREHNLKNIDVDIPRNKVTVITGLSGSGKSSLAFDTVYAEGQRRYLEGLSAYARNFLEQLKKPDVDSIIGLSPAISIEQKTTTNNPRSTVGTVTEIYDYLRLLYAKVGKPYCPNCKKEVESLSEEQVVDDILSRKSLKKFIMLSPVAKYKKGEFKKEFQAWSKQGFVKAIVDEEEIEIATAAKLKKTKAHNIQLIVDKIIIKDGIRHRLANSVNRAVEASNGFVEILNVDTNELISYSLAATCPTCNFSFPEIDPLLFSFNSPKGACEECNGVGTLDYEDYDFEDEEEDIDEYGMVACIQCGGNRLKSAALNVHFMKQNIADLAGQTVLEILKLFSQVKLKKRDAQIAEKIIQQLQERLKYLVDVGVPYLSLNRAARTLSGGESQRIRLASQLGSGLSGVLYVLDEPSIGLHPKDHQRLLEIIEEIRNKGNTILMVEHDEETIRGADLVVDLGPGAGKQGGMVLALGKPQDLEKDKASITGSYLSGSKKVFCPSNKRNIDKSRLLKIKGASGNNLKNLNVSIPLNTFTVVTGVSGSGKSTLVIDTLYRYIMSQDYEGYVPAPVKSIEGLENVQSIVNINQKPIGRTPRSNPATYVGLFTMIRSLFSELPDSKIRGFKPGYFSFNVKGGRCEHCSGAGMIKVEMNFLSNVYVACDYCQGLRYNPECLSIRYKGKNIAEVLNMTVKEALSFFEHHKILARKLKTLERVGLDYLHLGQSSTTLSGGEAQRIKLSKELSKRPQGHSLYILDEPTTGLHFADVSKLLELLHELVDLDNTVLVIEHNQDVVKASDHIIELGPEGGPNGGTLLQGKI